MLDIIGAGATASSEIDWHAKWIESPEAHQLLEELDELYRQGRLKPPVSSTLHAAFATSWLYQLRMLLERTFTAYWRNPTYIFAKLVLNLMSGLIIGLTFYRGSNSLQGLQDKLFVSLLTCSFRVA